MRKSKKGISPIIGAILLISLIVGMGIGYFVWMRGNIFKTGEAQSEQAVCGDVLFFAGNVCYTVSAGDVQIKFSARNDANELDLEGFTVYLDYEGGTKSVSVNGELKSLDSGVFNSEFVEYPANMKKVRIVPMIGQEDNPLICGGKGFTIVWGEIDSC